MSDSVDALLVFLAAMVPVLALITVCAVREVEPPSYRDVWYGD